MRERNAILERVKKGEQSKQGENDELQQECGQEPLLETRLPAEEGSHLVEAMKHVAMEAQRRLKTRSPHEEPPSVSFPNVNGPLKTDGVSPFPSVRQPTGS